MYSLIDVCQDDDSLTIVLQVLSTCSQRPLYILLKDSDSYPTLNKDPNLSGASCCLDNLTQHTLERMLGLPFQQDQCIRNLRLSLPPIESV